MPFQKIEVIAPYILRADQNFYDQPPFNQMFDDLRTGYPKISLTSFRTAATKISHAQYRELTLEGSDNEMGVVPEQTIIRLATTKGRLDSLMREALTHLNGGLDEYLKLKQYIATQLEHGSYTDSGNRSKVKTIASEGGEMLFVADSYAWWINRRLHRAPTLGRPKRPGDINLPSSLPSQKQINEALIGGEIRGEELRMWPLLKEIPENKL